VVDSGLAAAVAALPAPERPRDGDCLVSARDTARRLAELGYPAREVTVIGWLDPSGQVIGFVHRAVLIDPAQESVHDPADELGEDEKVQAVAGETGSAGRTLNVAVNPARIVDLTARQFDARLPGRWIAAVPDYEQRLAAATGVRQVVVQVGD
jgi:hypothetical protein